MKNFLKNTAISFAVLTTMSSAVIAPAYAAETLPVVQTQNTQLAGSFTKKKYAIKGQWQIIEQSGQRVLRLSDDFKTKKGPDLKLFLSLQTLAAVTGQTATQNAVQLSVLKTNKGSQDYIIPVGLDLASFQSLLIHCEAYSVLWGGSDL